jgi:hypothetical protein
MKGIVLVPLAVISLSPALMAQQVPHPGDRVRAYGYCDETGRFVPAPPEARAMRCTVIGSFLRVGPDSLTMNVDNRQRTYQLANIDRFEISQGQRSHGLLGAGVGFVVGSGIAYLIVHSGGSTSVCDQDANQDAIGTWECVGVVALGGAVGAGLGYIIGGRIHSERWTGIPLERMRITVGTARVGLAFSLPF